MLECGATCVVVLSQIGWSVNGKPPERHQCIVLKHFGMESEAPKLQYIQPPWHSCRRLIYSDVSHKRDLQVHIVSLAHNSAWRLGNYGCHWNVLLQWIAFVNQTCSPFSSSFSLFRPVKFIALVRRFFAQLLLLSNLEGLHFFLPHFQHLDNHQTFENSTIFAGLELINHTNSSSQM